MREFRLQKRPIILRSLLVIATPYPNMHLSILRIGKLHTHTTAYNQNKCVGRKTPILTNATNSQ